MKEGLAFVVMTTEVPLEWVHGAVGKEHGLATCTGWVGGVEPKNVLLALRARADPRKARDQVKKYLVNIADALRGVDVRSVRRLTPAIESAEEVKRIGRNKWKRRLVNQLIKLSHQLGRVEQLCEAMPEARQLVQDASKSSKRRRKLEPERPAKLAKVNGHGDTQGGHAADAGGSVVDDEDGSSDGMRGCHG